MKVARIFALAAFAASVAPGCNGCNDPSTRRAAGTPDVLELDEPRCLSIIAWNDLHGQIRPERIALDNSHIQAGGVIALADQISLMSATHDATVLLDAGDLFTGPLESTMAEGAPIIAAYKTIGVDAVTIGNHEFDFGPVGYARVIAASGVGDETGPDGPRGALMARMMDAPFPFLSANVKRADGSPTKWKNHLSHTIITRAGFRVGVVGYTTTETPTSTFRHNVVGLEFADRAPQNIADSIRAVRADGASPVVLLAHASLEGDLPEGLDDQQDPEGNKRNGEIATLIDKLGDARPDLIIAGHRHKWMLGRVRNIPIVSSDYHGIGLSRSRFCKEGTDAGKKVKLETIERRVSFASAATPTTELGAKVAASLAPWIAAVKKEADVVILELPRACEARAQCGTCLAEQVARSIAEHAPEAAGPVPAGMPVVGFVHTGALRAALPAGPLRYGDLFTSFPFENVVSVCGTTRAGLAKIIANATKDTSARDRLPFGITGARVRLRRIPSGDIEVVSVDLGDAGKSKDADPVWIALPDFLLYGGDGLLDGVVCKPSAASAVRVRDAWRTVLERDKGACEGAAKNVVVDNP